MYRSNIKTSQHNWVKQNLVTVSRGGKMFDEMICSNCKMKGRRYDFVSVEVSEKYKSENVHLCPKADPIVIPKKIKVIRCMANGNAFKNINPDSVHEVVTPPVGYKNDHTGVWVMGVGEPVKLLRNEYNELES
jgi:hypothetical protein